MKLTQKIVNQFNRSDTVIVVSTYPRKGHTYDPKALAVAPFTKNKINAISKFANKNGKPVKFVVLADTIEGEQSYLENDHLVIRCWTRNLYSVYLTIQKYINLFPNAKTIAIEHEFGIFGLKHVITAQLPIFLLLNRLLGKRIVLVLHQVIFDLSELAGHLQIDGNSFMTKALSFFIRANYSILGILANHLVVFDENLKTKLSKLIYNKKISAIPLPNSGKFSKRINLTHLKKNLGLDPKAFNLVLSGYVTWYKGADWLVKAVKSLPQTINGKKIHLTIAGGQSSSLEIDTKYMNWFNKLQHDIAKTKNITMTGVLDERTLPLYVKAADLMVMPYRLMMSSSGPFTLAQTSGTPVIISEKLAPMTDSSDFVSNLEKFNLKSEDFVFELEHKALKDKLVSVVGKTKKLKAMSNLVKSLGEKRTCQYQAKLYLKIFKTNLGVDSKSQVDLVPDAAIA